MSGDSTPAVHPGTNTVGKIRASSILTKSKSKEPLTGMIELRTDAARLQQLKRGRCGFEAGKPEEWRGRCAARDTVERHLNRGNTVVDFLCCLVWRDSHQAAVQPGMMPDGVALGRDPSHQAWMLGSRLADQEERRAHAFMGQRRQHSLRGRGPRAVVERQHHLVIPQRQRLRKALQPNPRGFGGVDAKNPRGTERSLAWTVRRLRRHCPCHQGNEGSSRPLHELPRLFWPSHIYHCAWCCPLGNA